MLSSALHSTTPIAVAQSTIEVINLWLHGKSKNTQQAYQGDLNSFLAFVEGKSLEQWTVNDIHAFTTALDTQGLKQSTVNRKVLAVKSLLTYAKKLGLIQGNAGAVVSVTRTKDAMAEKILTQSEVQEIIYTTPKNLDRAIIKLLYATGCRVSEILNLKWENASSRDRGVTQLSVFGKGNKTRQVLVKTALWQEIQIATGKNGEYVFSTRTGKKFDRPRVHRIIKAAGERVGLPEISAHWFRHSHASHSLDRGCPIHTVQKSLGHSSIETTQRYLHARPDDGSGLHLSV